MAWLLFGIAGLAVVLAGCVGDRVVYPGDGRLVIVDIDPDLDACPLKKANGVVTTIGAVVRAGLQYWNEVGVRLRTPNELSLSEEKEATTAPHLAVYGDACSIAGRDWDKVTDRQNVAVYHSSQGTIELYTRFWIVTQVDDLTWRILTSTIAHEFGHAIGLDHVSERDAVMYPQALPENARDNLADADVREYTRVWP